MLLDSVGLGALDFPIVNSLLTSSDLGMGLGDVSEPISGSLLRCDILKPPVEDEKDDAKKDILEGKICFLEFAPGVHFTVKKAAMGEVVRLGGLVSHILTKKCWGRVVVGEVEDSWRAVKAEKWGIPSLDAGFLGACAVAGALVDRAPFLHSPALRSGSIRPPTSTPAQIALKETESLESALRRRRALIAQAQSLGQSLETLTYNGLRLLRWLAFNQGQRIQLLQLFHKDTDTAVLTSHVYQGEDEDEEAGWEGTQSEMGRRMIALALSIQKKAKRLSPIPPHVGSPQLQARLGLGREVSEEAGSVVEWVWGEAAGALEAILSVPFIQLKFLNVDRAESALGRLRLEQTEALVRTVNEALHLVDPLTLPVPKRRITTLLDICTVLRDMLTVGEETRWERRPPTRAKLSALHCRLELAGPKEATRLCKLVSASSDVLVRRVVKLSRDTEAGGGDWTTLFHGTNTANLAGILSRGLLMPHTSEGRDGVKRTDVGHIGNAIYFSDNFKTSEKYAVGGSVRGVLVCRVDLGRVWETGDLMEGTTAPPLGFHSIHALPTLPHSVFKDSEYAVFDPRRVQLTHLILYQEPGEEAHLPGVVPMEGGRGKERSVCAPLPFAPRVEEPKLGLCADGAKDAFALSEFHVRVSIFHLVSEVALILVYENRSEVEVEGRYVMGVESGAAVCGLEAYIGGKKIVGEVKEAERARREYREAVAAGKGAYLGEEAESAEVLSLRLGNVPARTRVVLLVRYVADLKASPDGYVFSLSPAFAPWIIHVAEGRSGTMSIPWLERLVSMEAVHREGQLRPEQWRYVTTSS